MYLQSNKSWALVEQDVLTINTVKEKCADDSVTLLLVTQGETTMKLNAPRMLAIPPAVFIIILDANVSITPHTLWEKISAKINNRSLVKDDWELILDWCQMAQLPSLLPMHLQAS